MSTLSGGMTYLAFFHNILGICYPIQCERAIIHLGDMVATGLSRVWPRNEGSLGHQFWERAWHIARFECVLGNGHDNGWQMDGDQWWFDWCIVMDKLLFCCFVGQSRGWQYEHKLLLTKKTLSFWIVCGFCFVLGFLWSIKRVAETWVLVVIVLLRNDGSLCT